MHFGEYSTEDWSQVLTTENGGSSQESPQLNTQSSRNRNSNVVENSAKLQTNKEFAGSSVFSKEDRSSKSSVRAGFSYNDRSTHSTRTWNALHRLLKMLDDAETDNQFNEKTVFQAAESQGIDKESCIYYVPRGIINRGNTCFISAVLQALLAVDSFRLLFLYLLNIIRGATEEDIISWQDFSFQFPLVQKLCRVIEQCMLEGSNSKTSGENSANVQVLATKWYSRKESAQAMMSRISKSPISIEDWFQWRRSDFLPTQPDVLSWVNNDTRKGSDRKNSPQEINSSFVSPRLNSFLSFIFGGNQEDSQEFLIHILNELHEEIRTLRKYLEEHLLSSSELQTDGDSEYPKSGIEHHLSNLSFCRDNDSDDGFWEEVGRKGKSAIIRPFQFQSSWISFIFGGILRSELHRIGSKSSVSREPFLFLELDIQSPHVHNLYDALRLYIEPESLDDVFSETTKQKVQARKQVTIERLPRVFILQLKRFTLRNGDEVYRKLGKHIDFPVDLCLPSMLLTFSHSYTKPQNRSYSLAAVVTHLGRELVGGHYICDIRWRVPLKSGQREETVWLNCDDSSISCISEKTVLNRQAYLLFYVKKDES